MKAILALGLLILISYLGSIGLFFRRNVFSPFFYFFSSGSVYILFGLISGKDGLNILSSQVLNQLSPLINLGLGWIGFLYGFQLENKFLRQFPKKYLGFSFLYSMFLFLTVTLISLLFLKVIYSSYSSFILAGMAISFGILASISSSSFLPFFSNLIPHKGEYYRLAVFSNNIDDFWGIWGFALITSFWHFPFFREKIFIKGLLLFLGSIIFCGLLSIIFHLLTKVINDQREILTLLFGMVFFASGAASFFNLSPIFICMLFGFILTRLTKLHDRIYPVFLSVEKPLYIIFLILIGALWNISIDISVILLIFIFVGSRIGGSVLYLPLLKKILKFPINLPPLYGLTFLSQGGMAIALAINIKLIYSLPLTDIFLTVALLGILINEFLAPIGLKVSLIKLESQRAG
ncbi:hypothetical protein NLC26_03060 [Candidatus Aminicenantes bacterium AC-708-M15]|jgi:Kef-type K+ transport system membrane component KefB|nr:hypothetical protein [SCandidatus Aminicenantes bacterium Aminicenantia_JdfR_composite]MCP2597156.1 hypothetical protein [Candidatus Aminicenantes bacterium AC-335-G13]MCP2604443.1 hypothetical protein [Candidatus Aminicenantes bacterium AC-708-M15]